MSGKSSFEESAARLESVVRDVRERQRELSGPAAFKPPAESPGAAWARKFQSEGFGPESVSGTFTAGLAPEDAEHGGVMAEIRARAGAPPGPVIKPPPAPQPPTRAMRADLAMERPFAPPEKRGFWSKLFG
jgi:hypothetical protein